MIEIVEKKSKELERVSNEVTIMKVKLDKRKGQLKTLKAENLKYFEQMREMQKEIQIKEKEMAGNSN